MTDERRLIGVTETNSSGRVAICACGWASVVVAPQRGERGGLLADQTKTEREAQAHYRRHVRDVSVPT